MGQLVESIMVWPLWCQIIEPIMFWARCNDRNHNVLSHRSQGIMDSVAWKLHSSVFRLGGITRLVQSTQFDTSLPREADLGGSWGSKFQPKGRNGIRIDILADFDYSRCLHMSHANRSQSIQHVGVCFRSARRTDGYDEFSQRAAFSHATGSGRSLGI
jgi:hypothetical protein